jgi:hypothetical protein
MDTRCGETSPEHGRSVNEACGGGQLLTEVYRLGVGASTARNGAADLIAPVNR